MNEFEFVLFDRLEAIRTTISKYGEDKFYIAFSGGKDSCVVHHLIDEAIPNNRIPRVFSNTGIEYTYIYQFVKYMQMHDDRIQIITPKKNIKAVIDEVGYPFKSKEHSLKVNQYKKGSRCMSVMRYKDGFDGFKHSRFTCPDILKYQYDESFTLNISDRCCYEFKKKPFHEYEKESGRTIAITGMMREEGGQRNHLDCIITRNNKVVKFHPLSKVSSEWEMWYINERKIELCKLYHAPFNFKRTGCKGCPYALDLQKQLEVMQIYLPAEREQCEYIWKPVYDEYRRIGYRLKKEEQMKLL